MALRNIIAWGTLLASALVITYTWAPGRGEREPIAADKRKPAVDFALKDAHGQEVKLSDYKDKVVLVNFWATWCGPCKVEIPWFEEFQKTYKDQGLEVVGVSTDDTGWPAVQAFVESHGMHYRVLLDDQNMPVPYSQISAIPTTYLIDRQGRVAAVHTGLVSKDTYDYGIRQLLAN